jgi:hypothetical protein
VGSRAGLDAVVKRKISSPCRGPHPPIIQPVAQRYTAELPGFLATIRKLRNILRISLEKTGEKPSHKDTKIILK